LLLLGLGLVTACSRNPPPAPPVPSPAASQAPPNTVASAPAAPAATSPPTATAAATATLALATLKGYESIPEPWRTRFRTWLGAERNSTYVAVTDTLVISNAVSVVLLRHTEANGVCLEGPSKLDLIECEGKPELTREVEHFGDDCYPGTQCTRGPDGWNLRYLALLAAKNWRELSLLVPAKKKLTSVENGEKPSTFSRKDVASGRFSDAPSCSFMYNVTGCSELDEKTAGFSCRCDGGGYHVTCEWEREGDGFVVVAISESSVQRSAAPGMSAAMCSKIAPRSTRAGWDQPTAKRSARTRLRATS
jgi:hypothetical protein